MTASMKGSGHSRFSRSAFPQKKNCVSTHGDGARVKSQIAALSQKISEETAREQRSYRAEVGIREQIHNDLPAFPDMKRARPLGKNLFVVNCGQGIRTANFSEPNCHVGFAGAGRKFGEFQLRVDLERKTGVPIHFNVARVYRQT